MSTMILRSKTFAGWLRANLDAGQRRDLAALPGADAGWPGLTCTADLAKLYTRYEDELWNLQAQGAEEFGEPNVLAFIAGFQCTCRCMDADGFKTACVWYAAETLCRREFPDA